ncbi:hypothetical protein [Vagococcus sp. WN89Y]|uniref:hypothetical protein n=1 Tax=Vagococcus sp. WN89Y TaxID=3457258 RepID=UPI003FCDB630
MYLDSYNHFQFKEVIEPAMLNNLKKCFALTTLVAKEIKTNDRHGLESLKNRLIADTDIFAEWYKIVLPVTFSGIFTVFCFAIPQGFLWDSISEWLDWPEHYSVVGMVLGALTFCVFFMPLMFLIARGNFFALKLHVAVIFLVALVAVIYFISTYTTMLTGGDRNTWDLVGSVLGLIFIALSITCLNSPWFVKSTAVGLHNRILRELSKRGKQTLTATKR